MNRNHVGRLVGVAMAIVVALPVVAVAGHQNSGVASYTGCTTGGGGLNNLAAGDTPAKPCGANQTEVHLGGGDITEIQAGSGLTGGATNGTATLAVDSSAIQTRITGTCGEGSAVRVVNQDGTVVCETHDTGTDWSLTGNAGTTPGTHFLGTTDDRALEFRVDGARAFRLEPGFVPNVVGGDANNSTDPGVIGATIAGGGCPTEDSLFRCIGFLPNRVTANFGTVGGGHGNIVSGRHSTVAGGRRNTVSAGDSTVAGGLLNTATGGGSTVSGGSVNRARGVDSTVAGGAENTASAGDSTVAGGQGNTASGEGATVAGGVFNSAAGDFSFAAGLRAKVDEDHDGTFLWADSSNAPGGFEFQSAAANEFAARATGGVRFVLGAGQCTITDGSLTWSCTSDRATKTDFARVPGAQVLQRLAGLPITKWRFRGEDASVRHLGPVAQDFYRAFGLGTDNKQIAFADLAGVALKAAKALYRMVVSHDERIAALERARDRHKRRADRLERRLDRLEKTVADLAR